MCRMSKLRWLDVKDNPIHEALQEVAGDCLNEKQCMDCAKGVSVGPVYVIVPRENEGI